MRDKRERGAKREKRLRERRIITEEEEEVLGSQMHVWTGVRGRVFGG